MPDNTLSILSEIRTKVRRLTRSPSEAQISTAEIDKYINTFVLYDFPEELRVFALRTVLTFYTQPYIDVYETNTVDANDPLYNFKNEYVSIHGPVYISGHEASLTQSRAQFYGIFPKIQRKESIGTGDGATVAFAGNLSNKPVLRNEVLFSSINTVNAGLEIHDDGNGNLEGDVLPGGTINYVTGAYTFTFTSAPLLETPVYGQIVSYSVSVPNSVLYYENKFTLRPVPDQPYKVDIEAYKRPTELLNVNQSPDLAQWWQYISYGASKKVLEDRMDVQSVSEIMPEFKKQERLALRRTIVQQSNERTSTLYT